jgi:hypothetical protein
VQKILALKCYLETMPFMLDAQKNYTKMDSNTFVLLWAQAELPYLDAEEFMILLRLDCST